MRSSNQDMNSNQNINQIEVIVEHQNQSLINILPGILESGRHVQERLANVEHPGVNSLVPMTLREPEVALRSPFTLPPELDLPPPYEEPPAFHSLFI